MDMMTLLAATLTPEAVDAISNAGEVITQQTVSYLQSPWDAIVGVLSGLFIGLFRARQNRLAGRQIVKAIEAVKSPDKTVAFGDESTSIRIKSSSGRLGNIIVDEAQGKRKPAPF